MLNALSRTVGTAPQPQDSAPRFLEDQTPCSQMAGGAGTRGSQLARSLGVKLQVLWH